MQATIAVPIPYLLKALICPPIASTICFVMNKPRPVPIFLEELSSENWANFLNRPFRSSFLRPLPESITEILRIPWVQFGYFLTLLLERSVCEKVR